MSQKYCDCCGESLNEIIPYGASFLCKECLLKYLKELDKAPTIRKTNFNTAKRIIGVKK